VLGTIVFLFDIKCSNPRRTINHFACRLDALSADVYDNPEYGPLFQT